MPVVQSICDELIEVWGERGSVGSSQWDLVGTRQGGEAEKEGYFGEQHFQSGFPNRRAKPWARYRVDNCNFVQT